jgi:hypothetical protein
MKVARAAGATGKSGKEAAANFLKSTYYKSWSRAQLNNAEYAPMLALLCFAIKYKADKEERSLSGLEKISCLSSVLFSYLFVYAAANQGKVDVNNMRPGQAGMSPLRPVGAIGRYATMVLLLWLLVRPAAHALKAQVRALPRPAGDEVSLT